MGRCELLYEDVIDVVEEDSGIIPINPNCKKHLNFEIKSRNSCIDTI